MPRPIKTPAALAALNALSAARHLKRPALERAMSGALGHTISDDEFEGAMTELGRRIIRVRGGGATGGIYLA